MKKKLEYGKNFYVLDTETSGFEYNEPIQVSVLRYENGIQVDGYNQYFLPRFQMTDKAIKTHQLTRSILKERGAKKMSPGLLKILVNFLNVKKDLPIVSHNVDHDRNKVLKKAFNRMELLDLLPKDDRWECTFMMAK